MADITMPQLGETVTEGTITRWFKKVGDQVAEDEPLFEVSTDKVDSEVPAASAGYLKEILVEEGETVDVGAKLAVIDDAPPSANGSSAESEREAKAEPEPQTTGEPEPVPEEEDLMQRLHHHGGDLETKGRIDILADMSGHDEERLMQLISNHHTYTGSARAREILDDWATYRTRFVKVMPVEYRRALQEMERYRTLQAAE